MSGLLVYPRSYSSVTGEPCEWCGKRGNWSSPDPTACYTPPSGHTVHRDDESGTLRQTCPLEGAERA